MTMHTLRICAHRIGIGEDIVETQQKYGQRDKLQQNQDDSDGQTVDEEVPKSFS